MTGRTVLEQDTELDYCAQHAKYYRTVCGQCYAGSTTTTPKEKK